MSVLLKLLAADKARDRRTGEIVALKRLRMERERDGQYQHVSSRSSLAVKENQRPCFLAAAV